MTVHGGRIGSLAIGFQRPTICPSICPKPFIFGQMAASSCIPLLLGLDFLNEAKGLILLGFPRFQ
jgi:hypothetical protein